MSFDEKPGHAVDLSHHLSAVARARTVSPLTDFHKRYAGKPGVINLAGGVPSPVYFPWTSVSGEILVPDSFPLKVEDEKSSLSWLWKLDKERTASFTVHKYPQHPGDINMGTALQYGPATGLPQLQDILREFVGKVFQPAYGNWTTLMHAGNVDGWGKVVQTIVNPGEAIICSEWTYPSALASARPYNMKFIPITSDSEGIDSTLLRKTLAEWDEKSRGMRRPRCMYCVPVGENPTGITMSARRKKEIYKICVEYDIIIVEDCPYYFLQEGEYVPKSERGPEPEMNDETFIASLVPSYLKFDYQGRVIRLDTFSKTICPGAHLGWFTCNPMFAERLERMAEVSTHAPCGFTQIHVTSLLLEWQYKGYMRWLKALRLQYRQRRDYLLDCLAEEFHLQSSMSTQGYTAGALIYYASLKPKRSFVSLTEKNEAFSRPVFSFVPPTSGMFVWLKIHFEEHPSFAIVGYKALELKLWSELAEAGVVMAPGAVFAAIPVDDETVGDGHFRVSFSNSTPEEFKKVANIFAIVLQKFMRKQAD
ncbi:hypothetical protein GYMLUDRAFT_44904 [Collybiopsis luxurians FD-317 M1]|uniref:Aminotransferase class I/classII large domain-containing protein n=1 Tax=Collybiopsis luxurians FD-317 M1 TaxID=944289 RepID=A0A0D0BUJ7_9AGAR|nr:hypothetical protein GYMLUDRAFT_44904 [Collybiopsis luxurians FD-317 M1]